MKVPTASVRFITATQSMPLIELLVMHQCKRPNIIIESGGVWLGRQRLNDPHYRIVSGQTIKVYISVTQGYRYGFSPSFIIDETSDWVVVYKEPLITTGMDRSNQYFNLMSGLNDYFEFKDITSGVQPITRLDYRVAGVALFSKHKAAERMLFKQMQQKRIKKRYQILVAGQNFNTWYRVSDRLSSHRKAYEDPKGKVAKTAFVCQKSTTDMTYFDVSTITGRRHQIRYHASKVIAPVINDELYGYSTKDRHLPIGLIATSVSFKWKGHSVSVSLPNSLYNDWLKLFSGKGHQAR